VDVWHCDSVGIYSHFIEQSNGDPNGAIDNSTFLRGMQLTDETGTAAFTTIYPGWYQGRVIHLHIKVHFGGEVQWDEASDNTTGLYVGGSNAFTGQLFFSDEISGEIALLPPYNTNEAERLLLGDDGIYLGGGSFGMTTVEYVDASVGASAGLVAYVTLGVDPEGDGVGDGDQGGDEPPTRPKGAVFAGHRKGGNGPVGQIGKAGLLNRKK